MVSRQRLEPLRLHKSFPRALELIRTLQGAGHQALLAGGCVRDALMGQAPKDLDIATSALPDQVEQLFDHTVAVGKQFGTIVVVVGGDSYEVTTFRQDGPYLDGRHPSHVEFGSLQKDAERRDFTINALFYDPELEELHDFVGGQADLLTRCLRTVGSPTARFQEDRLRLLRAVRFRAQLGFAYDQDTWRAIKDHASEIASVSAERVASEMRRLLQSPFVMEGLRSLLESGMASHIWPEIMGFDVDRMRAFLPMEDWRNVFAAVMHLQGSVESDFRLRQWKQSRADIQSVAAQLRGLGTLLNAQTRLADRIEVLASEESSQVLLLVRGVLGDRGGQIQGWIDAYLKVADANGHLPKAFLNGSDLREVGVPAGEKMGLLLKALYREQLEGKIHSRADALEWLKNNSN